MARKFHEQVADVELTRSSHRAGTRTPSLPGQPPAIVGGHLKRSLRLYPAIPSGEFRATSKVIPLIVYARIQELGGTVTAHGKALRWTMGGKVYFAKSVTLPPRPYLRPVHRRMIADGTLRKAAIDELAAWWAGG